MNRRLRFTLAADLAVVALVVGATRRYRRDLAASRARLERVDRSTIASAFGVIEYAERGEGPALLVSHGIFHGCDGGLLAVRDVVDGRRVIVPSRFGYLGSTLPCNASSATQAEAFVAVLDRLDLDRVDVIGISAGTGAAIQLAIRHPDRVGHLVISSGNLPGSPTAMAPPTWAKAFYNDPSMWTLSKVGRPILNRLMGVPAGFPRDDAQARVVTEFVDSIFPLGPRRAGAIFDAFVSNPEVGSLPLESIEVPTLIVHARDDPLASCDAAERAAGRIPGARLLRLESGGHLALGQTSRIRSEIASFLGTPDGSSEPVSTGEHGSCRSDVDATGVAQPTFRTRLEHLLDSRSVRLAAWLYRRTNGRIAHVYHRNVLLLTTTGRRTGRPRTVPLQFFPDGDDMVVVAANSGMANHPGWYHNLAADPRAVVEVDGGRMNVEATELSIEDAERFWPRILERAPDYRRYPVRTDRRLPILRLAATA